MSHTSSSHSGSSSNHGHHDQLGHLVPYVVFLRVFIALLVLTAITVLVSLQDFGMLNIVVAMTVASIKALIVALFFMHLKYENPLTWLYAMFPIGLLALLIGLVFLDNPFRNHPQPVVPPVAPVVQAAPAIHHGQ